MSSEASEITQEIIDIAEDMGLQHSTEIKPLFYLLIDELSENDIDKIRNKVELAGFFFNGFGETPDGRAAIEFVYK